MGVAIRDVSVTGFFIFGFPVRLRVCSSCWRRERGGDMPRRRLMSGSVVAGECSKKRVFLTKFCVYTVTFDCGEKVF